MILNVKNLAFQYRSVPALDNISFEIPERCITVILGPNGAGKTTLLKCLNRILTPVRGAVLVNHRDIRAMSLRQIARQVGYVAQKNQAPRVTVYDAVLMGRFPHFRFRPARADLEKVDAVMERLGLTPMGLTHLDTLSGGELQKVAIARALVQETGLILMDEPTSSLDLKNQMGILGLTAGIVRDHGIAALMTMHDLNAALRFAHRFICLKDHTIYSSGRIDALSPAVVEAVYGIKVEILHHRGCPVVIPAAA